MPAVQRSGLLTFGETMGLVAANGIGTLDFVAAFSLTIGGAESNVAEAVVKNGARGCSAVIDHLAMTQDRRSGRRLRRVGSRGLRPASDPRRADLPHRYRGCRAVNSMAPGAWIRFAQDKETGQ
jgi:hypothetical protein